jgi:hypothetical protein
MFTVLISNYGGHEGMTRFNLWLVGLSGVGEIFTSQLVEEATHYNSLKAAQEAIEAVRREVMPHKRTKFEIYKNFGMPGEESYGSTIFES